MITNIKTSDGFGGQVVHIITAMVYAGIHNRPFVYSPFEKMAHNYDSDPEFLEKKERLLNLIGNIKTVDEARREDSTIVIAADNLIAFFDRNVARCARSSALQRMKEIFRANKNKSDYFDVKYLNVAIHIRRPNPHDTRIYGTDVPDSLYLQVISKLRKKYSGQHLLFHIYSQGNIDSFKMYEASDTVLHINESVEYTYPSLVFADILVTGRSSFSYTAGYLSDGIVYYTSYKHRALPHWISIEKFLKE